MSLESARLNIEVIPNPLYRGDRAQNENHVDTLVDPVGRNALSYPNKSCGICFQPLDTDVWFHVAINDKKHRFHGECIEAWVKINPSCPTCRADISDLGKKILLDDEGDSDFEFPKKYEKCAVFAAVSFAPFLLYDAVWNVNSYVIVPMIFAGTGLFVNKFAHPDFDNHGQSI